MSDRSEPVTDAPLVVEVNNKTASASEVLSGALQDNCRAVLVGERTLGKALIQSVYELVDGSGLILTTGQYITPSGRNIDQNGLQPDFKSIPRADEVKEALCVCSSR